MEKWAMEEVSPSQLAR